MEERRINQNLCDEGQYERTAHWVHKATKLHVTGKLRYRMESSVKLADIEEDDG
jgi:hypothetical protein